MNKKNLTIHDRPQYNSACGMTLSEWATKIQLPWLVKFLGLTAGAICGSLDESLRREVYGLSLNDELPEPINFKKNGLIISPPGTGKAVACFVEALNHFRKVYVVIPSRVQAMEVEGSLDFLYHPDLGGCMSAELKNDGLIEILTTGVMHQKVLDRTSDLWDDDTILFVDESQRTIDEDRRTQLMTAAAAHQGMRVIMVSATIAPGNMAEVLGHGPGHKAKIYQLTKQMHPIKIEVIVGDGEIDITKMPELKEKGRTCLVFCPTRKAVINNANNLQNIPGVNTVAVTGSHMVQEQMKDIKKVQKTGNATVVCGTPGTMDSGVTVDNLTYVAIEDRKIIVGYNQYGYKEVRVIQIPMNHMEQMKRRAGRQKRADGKKDKVVIFSTTERPDVLAKVPVFTPMTGGSRWAPVEDVILDAILLDLAMEKLQEYMVVNYPVGRIPAAEIKMIEDGMIILANCKNDVDGYVATEKGKAVANMPFESYKWRKLIVEAPTIEIKMWLALACSFSSTRAYQMFDENAKFNFGHDDMSDILTKINLGVEYISINFEHGSSKDADIFQRIAAEERDLSFVRLESMERLFNLAMRALGIDLRYSKLVKPTGEKRDELLKYLIEAGLENDIFQVFLPTHSRKSMTEARVTEDGKMRRFMWGAEGFATAKYSKQGITAVVAEQTWTTSRADNPMAYLKNVTIIPENLILSIITAQAEKKGWIKLKFKDDERGPFCKQDGIKYIPSRFGNNPTVGVVEYWCSIEQPLNDWITKVFVHYPVL